MALSPVLQVQRQLRRGSAALQFDGNFLQLDVRTALGRLSQQQFFPAARRTSELCPKTAAFTSIAGRGAQRSGRPSELGEPSKTSLPLPSSLGVCLGNVGQLRSSQSTSGSQPQPGFLEKAAKVLPGLALAGCVAQAGFVGADFLGGAVMASQGLTGPSPISGVPLAILLGLAINNIAKPPQALLQPGLKVATKAVLQAGIVCVGAKLSALEVAKLGVVGIPVVLCSITAGLGSVLWINARLGLPARLGSLTAAGTSICGVTAITALAPAIQANEQEVAYAVANVVAFGLLGMLVYPAVAHSLFDTSEQVGLFLGTAIHDTAQVMGAGLTYAEMYQDEVALKVAAVTKLIRNLFLAAVIPGLTYLNAKQVAAAAGGVSAKVPLSTLFPPFIFGFLGMAALRSIGDATEGFGSLSEGQWKQVTSAIGSTASTQLLGTAMAAVGLSTNFAIFKSVGLKPFAVGFAGAGIVGLTGYFTALFLGHKVRYESA